MPGTCFRHRPQRKPLVNDPGMHRGTCVTHVRWCMSGSLTGSGGENVPGIPGACALHTFTYLARDPGHDAIIFPSVGNGHYHTHWDGTGGKLERRIALGGGNVFRYTRWAWQWIYNHHEKHFVGSLRVVVLIRHTLNSQQHKNELEYCDKSLLPFIKHALTWI